MAKKAKKNKANPTVADDIRASLQEALKYVRGEKADVIVHRVVPRESAARKARLKLGLSEAAKSQRQKRAVIASQRVRPEVAGPMTGSAKQSSRAR